MMLRFSSHAQYIRVVELVASDALARDDQGALQRLAQETGPYPVPLSEALADVLRHRGALQKAQAEAAHRKAHYKPYGLRRRTTQSRRKAP